ncbi:MAG: hypothetical protein IPO85_12365 [Saprospiraceae bacterium]|uniref:Uncharacterized protein n=1 Tax=Candidatus Defluviibacterium haderslevense TaxID=2981993 RepID=A0A9D7SBR0_9BACT|nr:hypothetical protein [Candidatus Defluviibacterium haderslevense]
MLGIGDAQMTHAMNGPLPPRKIVHQFSEDQNAESEDDSEEDYTEEEFLRIQNAVNDLSQVFDDPITTLGKNCCLCIE